MDDSDYQKEETLVQERTRELRTWRRCYFSRVVALLMVVPAFTILYNNTMIGPHLPALVLVVYGGLGTFLSLVKIAFLLTESFWDAEHERGICHASSAVRNGYEVARQKAKRMLCVGLSVLLSYIAYFIYLTQ